MNAMPIFLHESCVIAQGGRERRRGHALAGQYAKFKIEGNSMAVPGFEAVAVVTEDSKNFKKGQRVIVKHWPGIDKASGWILHLMNRWPS